MYGGGGGVYGGDGDGDGVGYVMARTEVGSLSHEGQSDHVDVVLDSEVNDVYFVLGGGAPDVTTTE